MKHERQHCPETLVELGPADLPKVLTKLSIVDCNDVTHVTLADFCARWESREIRAFETDLPPVLRKALRTAIHASKIVTEDIKALVAAP